MHRETNLVLITIGQFLLWHFFPKHLRKLFITVGICFHVFGMGGHLKYIYIYILKNKNINMAVYNFVKSMITGTDKRHSTIGLLIDIFKTFDHLRFDVPLDKLYQYRSWFIKVISFQYKTNHRNFKYLSWIEIQNNS